MNRSTLQRDTDKENDRRSGYGALAIALSALSGGPALAQTESQDKLSPPGVTAPLDPSRPEVVKNAFAELVVPAVPQTPTEQVTKQKPAEANPKVAEPEPEKDKRVRDLFDAAVYLIAFAAALRGITKGIIEPTKWLKNFKEFISGRSLTAPSTNFHLFKEVDGKTILEINTIDQPNLNDVFRNSAAVSFFKEAAKLTSNQSPFVGNHYGQVLDKPFWKVLKYLSGAKYIDQLSMRQRFNKLLVQYYSTLKGAGVDREASGQGPVKDVHVLIPIIEKDHELSASGRRVQTADAVFAVLSFNDFRKFSDSDWVKHLTANNPERRGRIQQLKLAWAEHENFAQEQRELRRSRRAAGGQEAVNVSIESRFPLIRVYPKAPKNGVPSS